MASSIVKKPTQEELEQMYATAKGPQVFVYRCLCSELALILGKPLTSLPRRRTDKARVLDTAKEQYKFHGVGGKTVCLNRPEGKERQYRKNCGRCGLLLAYRTKRLSPILFLVHGSFEEEKQAQNEEESTLIRTKKRNYRAGKSSSVSMATTTEEEEQELQSRELGRNYDANAMVIERLMQRGVVNPGREQPKPARNPSRRKGTLLN